MSEYRARDQAVIDVQPDDRQVGGSKQQGEERDRRRRGTAGCPGPRRQCDLVSELSNPVMLPWVAMAACA
jgi:hypothetical protein